MGERPFLIAACVNLIMAQRLVRTVCDHCKELFQPAQEVIDDIKKVIFSIDKNTLEERLTPEQIKQVTFWRGRGCDQCDGTGYRGRIGLYEILVMDEDIKKMIVEQHISLDIHRTGLKKGMLSLEQDGVIKIMQGKTSIEEVYRVTKK